MRSLPGRLILAPFCTFIWERLVLHQEEDNHVAMDAAGDSSDLGMLQFGGPDRYRRECCGEQGRPIHREAAGQGYPG